MSTGTPPTLEELSRQALLRNEALAISALEKLPNMLFPALFKEAFNSRCTGIVKAMVVAWPFPYLHVKGITNTFDSEIFHAVLDGLDVLPTQQVCPMRGDLRVLIFGGCPSHLKDFALCPSLHQLEHLDLSGPLLRSVSTVPLSVLLEMGAGSLETLELQGCRIKDSQFRELLPAFSQCSQLTKVNFYSNDFSMNLLRDLFYHTANMSKMTMEQYPAPRECYAEWENISIEAFSQLCSQLVDTLRAIRQPKRIRFATYLCDFCSQRCVYDQETRLCSCLQ
ncbi:PRAME family member 12 [Microtus ochrogaster]|uniref:PRAME family member 12 n=1 Tax=Microtus ochrogaster TaxID=79684 RepID=A0A8J6GFE4_MICOH|nr:PRAME family member 12 [Microtus ochrogaster]